MIEGVSTGSTLLNLACTGDPNIGFVKGKYIFLVGDSASGKTFLSMTCFAEAARDQEFNSYRFIYDNIEDGMMLDIDSLFGEKVADRIEPPERTKDGTEIFSDTVESFYFHLDDAIKAGKPFIYVLDSMDALDTEAGERKFEEQKKAVRSGKDISGSYGDVAKAKRNSEYLRKAMKGLRDTGSILIILSQTRDNIGSMFGGKTRAGGRALRFYATVEIWSSIVEHIIKVVNKKKRKIGVRVKLEVRKNRIIGKLSEVEVDIFPNYGIDDIGSCVDFLVEEGRWTINDHGIINATDLKIAGSREKVIHLIEDRGVEDDLRDLCGVCWNDIDAACSVKRKNRYE